VKNSISIQKVIGNLIVSRKSSVLCYKDNIGLGQSNAGVIASLRRLEAHLTMMGSKIAGLTASSAPGALGTRPKYKYRLFGELLNSFCFVGAFQSKIYRYFLSYYGIIIDAILLSEFDSNLFNEQTREFVA